MELKDLVFNKYDRPRSGWRFLSFAVLYFFVLFVLTTGARVLYAISIRVAPSRSIHDLVQNLIFRCVLLAAALLAGYVCARWLERLPWRSLGMTFHRGWFRHFIIGSLVGIASLALAAGIAAAGGGLRF